MPKVRAKTLTGKKIVFDVRNVGLLTPARCAELFQRHVQFDPMYVTRFEMTDGEIKSTIFSKIAADKSNGSDDARFDADCATLRHASPRVAR